MDVTNMTDAEVREAFEAWDEGEAWERVANESSNRAQFEASLFCYGYEHYSPTGFEWSEVTAEQILESR